MSKTRNLAEVELKNEIALNAQKYIYVCNIRENKMSQTEDSIENLLEVSQNQSFLETCKKRKNRKRKNKNQQGSYPEKLLTCLTIFAPVTSNDIVISPLHPLLYARGSKHPNTSIGLDVLSTIGIENC